jgi:hypothetical protein
MTPAQPGPEDEPLGMPHIDLPERTDNPTVLRLRRRLAERDERIAILERELSEARALLGECERAFDTVTSGFDHDADAHRYGTTCRCCLADDLLTKLRAAAGKESE